MFTAFLRFARNRAQAPEYMSAHNDWIAKGFNDGVFLCVGSLTSSEGGAILAAGESRAAFEARIAADPFVAQGIVEAEIHEIAPKRTRPEVDFLKAQA